MNLRDALKELREEKCVLEAQHSILANALEAVMEALERIEGLRPTPMFVCPHGTHYSSELLMKVNCGKFTENVLGGGDCRGEAMIYQYDSDEVVSTEEIEKHSWNCPKHFMNVSNGHCVCDPIHGTRIVLEKWDDYTVKPKEQKNER